MERNSEDTLRELLKKIKKQQQIISEISSLPFIASGEVEKIANHITEIASQTAGIERVGIWLFNKEETELKCIDLYEALSDSHSAGYKFSDVEFCEEFSALKSLKYIISDDPVTDIRMSGYVNNYIKNGHITSILNYAIGFSGKNFGKISFEYVDKLHHWEEDEIIFASQIADQIGLTISNREKNIAKKALDESEKKYRRLCDHALPGIFQTDPGGKIININSACAQLFGYSSSEEIMEIVNDIAKDMYTDPLQRTELIQMIINNHGPVQLENQYRRKDGSTFTGNLHVWPIWDDTGELQYLEGFVEDITEKLRKEEDFREQDEINRFIWEHAGDVIWLLDFKKDRFKYISPSVIRLRGFTQEEVMKQSLKDVLTEESFRFVSSNLPGIIDDFLSSNSSLKVMTYELDQKCKDGSIVNTEVVFTFLKDNLGEVSEILGIGRNITARKKAQEELRKKTEELEKFFNNSLDLLSISDTDGYFHILNPEWEKVLGYDIKELEGRKFLDFVHPDDMEETIKTMKNLSEQKEILNFTNRYMAKDGTYRWIEWRSYPSGNLIYASARDITERKEIEEALKASEAKYRRIVDTTCEGIWMMNGNFETIFVNFRMTEMLGYSIDEMLGKNISTFMCNEELEDHHKKMSDRQGGISQQYVRRYIRKDGEIIWLFTSATPIFDREGNFAGSCAMLTDITDRIKTEEALRKSEEKYRKIFENIIEGIFQTTPEGRYLTVNHSLVKMFGYSSQEEMISAINDIDHQVYVNPEDRLNFKDLLEKNNKVKGFEIQSYKKTGQIMWHSLNAYTVRDKNGNILYYEGTCEDITARKEMEEALNIEKLKLEQASIAGKVGLWTWHIQTGIIEWSDSIKSMLGHYREELSGNITLWEDIIHPMTGKGSW